MEVIAHYKKDNNIFLKGYNNFKEVTKRKNNKEFKHNSKIPNHKVVLEIEKTLEDIIPQYEEKGYIIPDLSDEKNLFKLSPLLVPNPYVEKYVKNQIEQNGEPVHNFNKDILFLNNFRFAMIQGAKKTEDEKKNLQEIVLGRSNSVIQNKIIPKKIEVESEYELMHNVRNNYYANLQIKKIIKEQEKNRDNKGLELKKSRFYIGLDTPKIKKFNPNETIITSLKSEEAAFKSKYDVGKPKRNTKELPSPRNQRKQSQFDMKDNMPEVQILPPITNNSNLLIGKMTRNASEVLQSPIKNGRSLIRNASVLLQPYNNDKMKRNSSMELQSHNNRKMIRYASSKLPPLNSNLNLGRKSIISLEPAQPAQNKLATNHRKSIFIIDDKRLVKDKVLDEKEIKERELELQNQLLKKVQDAKTLEEEKQRKQHELENKKRNFIVHIFEKFANDKDMDTLKSDFQIYSDKFLHDSPLNINDAFVR